MTRSEPARSVPATGVGAADISPDGKTLITGSADGTLAEWDMETGERRRVLIDPAGLTDETPRIVVVSDGREVEPPLSLRRLSEPMRGAAALSIRFSPDGKVFAVGAANGYVVLWHASSRAELYGWAASDAGIVALDISPDRKCLATGSLEEFGKTFRVWSLRQPHPGVREVFSDDRHILGVWAVCFSPDGLLVAAGGWTMSGYNAPQLYEAASGKPLGGLEWDVTRSLQFSPDGRLVLTGGDFGDVKLWDAASKELLQEFKAHAGIVNAVGFSPDNQRYFSASLGDGIKIWEVKDEGRLVRQFPVERPLACRFAKDGRALFAASAAKGADRPLVHRLTMAA